MSKRRKGVKIIRCYSGKRKVENDVVDPLTLDKDCPFLINKPPTLEDYVLVEVEDYGTCLGCVFSSPEVGCPPDAQCQMNSIYKGKHENV